MVRRKKRILLLAGVLLLLSLIPAGILFFQVSRIENRFPLWEPAEEQPPEENVTAQFTGIDFDVTSSESHEKRDLIHIQYAIKRSEYYKYFLYRYDPWQLEYFHDGSWYVIYRYELPELPDSMERMVPMSTSNNPIDEEITFAVPVHTLSLNGTYRLYKANYGYCVFKLD